jgi:hypothetical protein
MKENSTEHVAKNTFVIVTAGLGTLLLGALVNLGWIIIHKPKVTVNCPILVRGGSMTAFTIDVKSGWSPKTDSQPSYCVDMETANSSIAFVNESDSDLSFSWAGLPPTWTVEIRGNDSNGAGMTFMPQGKNCSDHAGTSVKVSSSKNGGFYPVSSLAPHGHHTDNRRFKFVGCDGDEDLCERMAKVIVTIDGKAQPTLVCGDGDCSVGIGPPL